MGTDGGSEGRSRRLMIVFRFLIVGLLACIAFYCALRLRGRDIDTIGDPVEIEILAQDAPRQDKAEASEALPIHPWQEERSENIQAESVEETIENLANFDDQHLAQTSISGLLYMDTSPAFQRLVVTRLARVRRLLDQGRRDPEQVVPPLRRSFAEALAGWSEEFTNHWRAIQAADEAGQHGLSRSGPDQYSKYVARSIAATYLLAELGDHQSLPLMLKCYQMHVFGDPAPSMYAPVPPALTLYAMHRLVLSFPEEQLTDEARLVREDYLQLAECLPPPEVITVTRNWAAYYDESDPRVTVFDPKGRIVSREPTMEMVVHAYVFTDGEVISNPEGRVSERTDLLFKELERFVEAAYPPWGEAVEGVQVRLRANRAVWQAGYVPTFKIDLRSQKVRRLPHWLAHDEFEVGLDGKWYQYASLLDIRSSRRIAATDRRGVHLALLGGAWQAEGDGSFLALPPGRHTVQVAFLATDEENEGAGAVRAVSNPVEIEIVPLSEADEAAWGEAVEGVVRLPDGTPAAGAETVLLEPGYAAEIEDGRFKVLMPYVRHAGGREKEGRSVRSDAEGRFRLPWPEAPYAVWVSHDEGWSEAPAEELSRSHVLTLKPWGCIEGQVLAGKEPVKDAGIHLQVSRSYDQRGRPTDEWSDDDMHVTCGYDTRTDEKGRFAFEAVMPGKARLTRALDLPDGGQCTLSGLSHSVKVEGGQTIRITLGGAGRPVIGRIVQPAWVDLPINWDSLRLGLMLEAPPFHVSFPRPSGSDSWSGYGAFLRSEEGKRYGKRSVKLGADGSFRMEGVPAGTYLLQVRAHGPEMAAGGGKAEPIARLSRPVTVPLMRSGKSDEPLDLGTLELRPAWGEAVEGVQIRLRRGKGVWAFGEMPTVYADVRNGGARDLQLVLAPGYWEFQLDALWYCPTGIYSGEVEKRPFGPRQTHNDIFVPLDAHYGWRRREGDEPLRFGPGKHMVRVAFTAQPAGSDKGGPVRAVSNPVEIEVLPAPGSGT